MDDPLQVKIDGVDIPWASESLNAFLTEIEEKVARAIDPVAWGWIDRTREKDPEHIALPLVVSERLAAARRAIAAYGEATAITDDAS